MKFGSSKSIVKQDITCQKVNKNLIQLEESCSPPSCMSKLPTIFTYLSREAFHKDGHQQVEQHIVSKSHKCNKIEGSPVTCLLHAIEKYNIPVLLSKYLQQEGTMKKNR